MFGRDRGHYYAATPGPAMLALGFGILAGAWVVMQLATPPPGWLPWLASPAAVVAWRRGLCLCAGIAAGCAVAGISLTQALEDRLDPALDAASIELIGIIEDLPMREPRRVVLTVRIESPKGLPQRARIAWYEAEMLPGPGERWRFRAKLQRPRGVVNIGRGSREAWLLRQRIGATGYASGPSSGELLARAADPLLDLRARSAARIAAAVGDSQQVAVLTAIVLGFRGGLDAATREMLAVTGTGHLLAISGLHVGLAAAAGGLLAGALARRLGGGRRPTRDWAALGAVLAACAYCVLAGLPVSARRAVLMTAVGLGALVARRGHSLSAAVGIALALVLLADPLAVLDPGLWLSFGAVVTILAVVAGRRGPAGRLAWLLRIQAALAVGMLVCTAAWFGRVSVISPLANLFAVPWFSILVVPPALGGVVLSWLVPPAGAWALSFAGEAIRLALLVIEQLAGLPKAAYAVATPAPVALLLGAAGAAWCLLPRPAPGRALAPLLLAPLLLPGAVPLTPGSFEVRVFDVGHGLAVLVRTRNGVLLYDTGPSWPGGDAAGWTVLPAMRSLGVRRLDAILISHGHADHLGGLDSLLAAFPGTPVRVGYGAEGADRQLCRTGLSWSWDGVRFSVLHPLQGFRGGQNDGSCVLLVDGPGGRVLLTGDIERSGERALLTAHGRIPADLVIAPHHGSRTSSGLPLVASTRPGWVVFSTNWRNRWGFPALTVVQRWHGAGAMPLSTERHGEILVRFDAQGPVPPALGRSKACRAWLDCGWTGRSGGPPATVAGIIRD